MIYSSKEGKMIKLKIADYCHDCKFFNPIKGYALDFPDTKTPSGKVDEYILVACENAELCERWAKCSHT